jgi:hypothetical protein
MKIHNVYDLSMLPQLCPTEEESGMLMSSLSVNVHMCGWVGEKKGYLRHWKDWIGWKIGLLILSMGLAGVEISIFIKKGKTLSKRATYWITTHAINIVDMFYFTICLNIFSPLQVKINHVTEIRNMRLFLVPMYIVQLQTITVSNFLRQIVLNKSC